MKYGIIVGIILSVIFYCVQAQGSRVNEVVLGLGATFPKEASPLNVTHEEEMPTSLIGNAAYRRYIAELVTIGIRAFGTVNTLSDYYITTTSNPTPRKTEFTLTTISIGLEGMLLLSDEGHAKPYLSALLLYSSGILTNQELGKRKYQGFSWGIGLGLRIDITKTTSLLLEGTFCFGNAKYDRKPFNNSLSDEFDPSTILLTTCVLFSFK